MNDIVIRSLVKVSDKDECTSGCKVRPTTVLEIKSGNSVFLTRLCDEHAAELGRELIAFAKAKPVKRAGA
jgi:hypothetical protein